LITPPSDTFLQINDSINTVLNRYEAFKKGDFATSSNPIPAEYASGSSSSTTAGANALSLIDLDESAPVTAPSAAGGVHDLAGLFGSSAPATTPLPSAFAPAPIPTNGYGASGGSGVGTIKAPSPQQQQQVGAIVLPGTPKPRSNPVSSGSSLGGTNAPTTAAMGMGVGMGVQPISAGMLSAASASSPQPPQSSVGSTTQRKDPFADLANLF
jgi:ADP-ribosylation factor-binding protein GGA